MFFAILGSWNGSDDLDECRMESSDDSSGTNTVEVTTDASEGNYDTDSPIDADGDGDFVIIEVRAEDIDSDNANPQRWLRGTWPKVETPAPTTWPPC